MMMHRSAGLLVALGTVWVSTPSAQADDYSGHQPTGAVVEDAVGTREAAVFGADCFVAGATVTLSVSGPGEAQLNAAGGETGASEVSAKANAKGQVVSEVTTPTPGAYEIRASGPRTCATGAADASFMVVNTAHTGSSDVTAQSLFASPSDPKPAAVTGDSLLGQLGLGVVLVGLGSGAIWLARRRILRW